MRRQVGGREEVRKQKGGRLIEGWEEGEITVVTQREGGRTENWKKSTREGNEETRRGNEAY